MSMMARIYRPTKTAMQSGKAGGKDWLFEYEPARKFVEPLMGWESARDTSNQVRLWFPTKEAAIDYATRQQIPFEVTDPNEGGFKPKTYAANFAFNKVSK